jgi:hypothetical protein
MLTCNGTCAAHLLIKGAAADKKLMFHTEYSIDVSFIDAKDVARVQSKVKDN